MKNAHRRHDISDALWARLDLISPVEEVIEAVVP